MAGNVCCVTLHTSAARGEGGDAAGMQLHFAPYMTPVHGGIIAKDATRLVVLSLALVKLDLVDGY